MSVENLIQEIAHLARSGDFQKAEQLRGKLLEQYPMELSAAIKSAELIEEEKDKRIDKNHLVIWDELYSELSQEERNALYYATGSATITEGKLILKQGNISHRLLMIDKGKVTLFHQKGKERVLVGQVSVGEMLGDETFFNHSTSTFSAGCRTDVQVRYLDKKMIVNWEEDYPGLYQKIFDYCRKNNRSADLLAARNIEKRHHPRVEDDGKVMAALLIDNKASKTKFRGTLSDISKVGVGFLIHSSRPESAYAMLGRKLILDITFEGREELGSLTVQGRTVKVGTLLHNDFSIHVQLGLEIPNEELGKYVKLPDR